MPSFDLSTLPDFQRPTAIWAGCLLRALVREELRGRRPRRLTEPKLDTWRRFRGRLTSADLLALMFEDAAVIHPIPFAPEALGKGFRPESIPDPMVDDWLASLTSRTDEEAPGEYIGEQARALELSTRMARSELHVLRSHHRVLELPGSGGQLAHHLVTSQQGLSLKDNFVIACATWQELTLAGLVEVDVGAPHADAVVSGDADELKNPEHPLRQRAFDYVIGLHPEKGGPFRVEDQLAIWFPTAKVLLV